MICGTGGFRHVDKDPSSRWTPKGRGKKRCGGRSKNPYSTMGLDKFSTVQAELEAMRERILAHAGPRGVSMVVHFMYSNSHDWIPIVGRLHDPKQRSAKPPNTKNPLPPPPKPGAVVQVARGAEPAPEQKSLSWWVEGGWRWRHGYYWPLVMVVILLSLVVFGRIVAVCCTSIWWYLVPIIEGEDESGGGRR